MYLYHQKHLPYDFLKFAFSHDSYSFVNTVVRPCLDRLKHVVSTCESVE